MVPVIRLFGAAMLLGATPALADVPSIDGIYRPDFEWAQDWDCTNVGQDGGAIAIVGNQFKGIESSCTLSTPVNVRGMPATLYDATCTAEGEEFGLRMMFLRTEGGITLISGDGAVAPFHRCELPNDR